MLFSRYAPEGADAPMCRGQDPPCVHGRGAFRLGNRKGSEKPANTKGRRAFFLRQSLWGEREAEMGEGQGEGGLELAWGWLESTCF